MSKYFLSSHVRACRTDNGIVFLDLKHHRYIGLGGAQSHALASLVHGWPSSEACETRPTFDGSTVNVLAETLVTRGLLTRYSPEGCSAEPLALVAATTIDTDDRTESATRVRLPDFLKMGVAWLEGAAMFNLLPLARVVRVLERRSLRTTSRHPPADMASVRELLMRFHRLRPWFYTAAGACLFDSLVLINFLVRYGVPATLVLGVATKPFRAHAWVAHRSVVLNDTLNRIQEFSPILATRTPRAP